MGAAAWVDMQLETDSIGDTALESQLLTLIARTATNAADVRMAARAVFSQRQLAWRMVYFLNNHFATYRPKTQPISETNEDDTFRRLCFGRFADVLRASAQSPAMIDFLDSQTNVSSSPNENYARELMELHTLGVGVYTEADVAAISRVFTGWSRVNTFSGTTAIGSKFDFRPTVHTQGPKTTSLGWSTPGFAGAAGVNEGLSFLEFLAGHVETARRFVRKLCVYFVSDQPSAALVGRAVRKFCDTGGDLKATVRCILLDPDFATTATARGKAMDGFEFAVSSVRRLHLTTMTTYTTLLTRVGILRALPRLRRGRAVGPADRQEPAADGDRVRAAAVRPALRRRRAAGDAAGARAVHGRAPRHRRHEPDVDDGAPARARARRPRPAPARGGAPLIPTARTRTCARHFP